MLEIILIVVLTGKLRTIAQSKGRSAGWAALGPVLWIGGEVLGAVAGAIMGADGLSLYGGAILGAVVGAGIAWAIVNGLSAGEGAYDPASGMSLGIQGGNYDPSNPYNAPGGAPAPGAPMPGAQQGAPPPSNPNSPFA